MTDEHASLRAVVLLSGGLDSTTTLAIARDEGRCCFCLSFAYGQRQAIELKRAAAVAERLRAERHLVLRLDLDQIGGSALTSDLDVPKGRNYEEMESAIPVTYVPGRNTIFLAYAVAWAETLRAAEIYIGVNALDYSGYPDCRPEFLAAFEKTANLGTRAGNEGKRFAIRAPLLHLSKKEIIQKGLALGVDYALTHSCYDPDEEGRACGECDSCRLRLKGFAEAGIPDPAIYRGGRP
jgi:7-cyano-7-deazaguanine synthase